MAVDLEKIEKIKRLALNSWLPSMDLSRAYTLESLEEGLETDPRLSVGYGLDPEENQYVLQIRVGTERGPVYQNALKAKKLAETEGTTAEIITVDQAHYPTQKEVKITPPHLLLGDRKEELHIGLSVGHPDGSPGTLGAFVETADGIGILSCSHVLARSGKAEPEDWIHHPGKPDVPELSPRTRVARLTKDFIEFSRQGSNSMDAAIAVMPDNIRYTRNIIPIGLGCPVEGQALVSIVDPRTLPMGTRIGKVGRSTGYAEGTLTATALEIVRIKNSVLNAQIPFTNVIEVTWDADLPFSKPGDSGAILFTLDPIRAIGIHFAGNNRQNQQKTGISYACHLDTVLTYFKAELVR
jgi:hypothetical protein